MEHGERTVRTTLISASREKERKAIRERIAGEDISHIKTG